MKANRVGAAGFAFLALVGLVSGTGVAAIADDNPATRPLAQVCTVVPSVSDGSSAGLPLVAQGESVTLSQRVTFDPGTVYQDVFERADGSVYYASVVELDIAGATGITVDPASATARLGGSVLSTTAGTEPSGSGFVIDQSAPGVIRLYFPGDVQAMIDDPTGYGVPSTVIPTGGATLELQAGGVITATVPGTEITAGTCYASISTGPSNRNTTTDPARASLASLALSVDKSADREVAIAGSEITYGVRVDVPTVDATGIPVGGIYDAVITDELPTGLTPVAGSISHAGVFDAGVITWQIAHLEPGSTTLLSFRAIADAAAGVEITNEVHAIGSGLPGAVGGERSVESESEATVTISGTRPSITKQADVETASIGSVVSYDVEVAIPAGAPYYDVAIVDLLPDGLENVTPVSFACAGCLGSDPAVADLGPQLADSWELGWFLGDLAASAVVRTYTITYTAEVAQTHLDGGPVLAGDTLDNIAEVVWNDVNQLVGPAGLIDRSGWSGSLTATDTVTVGVPELSIEKTLDNAAPLMAFPDNTNATWLTYRVKVTNTGLVDAYNVQVKDSLDDDAPKVPTSRVVVTAPSGSTTLHPYSLTEQWIEWAYAGPLAPGASVEWVVRVGVPLGTSITDPFTNLAEVTNLEDENGTTHAGPDPVTREVNFGLPRLTPTKTLLTPASGPVAPGETVTWQVSVVNDGDVTANRFQVCDSPEGGYTTYVAGSVSGVSISAPTLMTVPPCDLRFTVTQPLAPGATYTFTYQTRIPADAAAGSYDNTVLTGPYLFGTAELGTFQGVLVSGTDDASVTVTKPVITIDKTPKASQNIPILQGGTGTYQIVVTNTSSVAAVNLVVTDVLPGQLSYPGGYTTAAAPISPAPVITANVTSAPAGGTIVFTIGRLAPGQSITFSLPIQHNNASVADYPVQTNVATVTGPGLTPVSSEGVLYPQTLLAPPSVVKSVDDDLVVPTDTVTFTADVTIPDNSDDMFDVTVVDTMADGFTPAAGFTVLVECLTGTCVTPAGSVAVGAPVQEADGSWRFNAFIGDVPASVGAFTYRFTYSAILDEQFEGTGTPAAGTLVLGGELGVPVVNSMVPRFNYADVFSGLPALNATFTGRGYSDTAEVSPLTPNVLMTKRAAESSIEVGDTNTYTIDVTNVGTGPATDVVVTDDTAGGSLRGVVLDPSNVVGPTDGWTLGDPDLEWIIPSIAPGATVTLVYTATTVPSDELASEAANYDAMKVTNTAVVTEFRGGSVVYSPPRDDTAIVYVHTPRADVVQTTSVANCPVVDQGETWTFQIIGSNTPTSTGLPANIAPLRNVVIDEALVNGLTYVPGSTVMSGVAALPAGSREPQVISNPDGSSILRWLIPELPAGVLNSISITLKATATDAVAVTDSGALAFVTLSGEDATGESSRGGTSGQPYAYTDDYPTGCITPPQLEKEPTVRSGLVNDLTVPYVDPGDTWVWDTTLRVNNQALNGVVLTDTLPAGVTYVSSTLAPTSPAGPAVTPTSETVTPLGDGRTVVTLAYPGTFTADTTFVLDMTTTIDLDVPPNLELVNSIELSADEALFGVGCAPDTHCSTGTVRTRPAGEPTLTKTVVGDASQLFGSTFTFELDVMVPKDRDFDELVVFDAINLERYAAVAGATGSARLLAFKSTVSATCYQGCSAPLSIMQTTPEPANTFMQSIPLTGASSSNVGWVIEDAAYSGHLSAHTEDRYVRIVFEVDSAGVTPPSGTGAAADFFTRDRATLAYSTNPAYNINRIQSWTLEGNLSNGYLVKADEAYAEVEQYQPLPALTKTCWDAVTGERQGEDSQYHLTTHDEASITPTPPGIPNLRCEIEVAFDPNSAITGGLYDITVNDVMTSFGSTYAVEGEFVGYGTTVAEAGNVSIDGSAIPTVNPGASGSPGRWTIDHLLPGESATVTMLYRVISTPLNGGREKAIGYGTNTATVESFAVIDGGTPVASTITDSLFYLVHRPVIDVSKRVAPGEQPGLSDDEPREAIVGEPVTYEVRVDITQQGDQRYITLTDSLPVGWEYVPGTATVKAPDPNTVGETVFTSDFEPSYVGLFEPTVAPSSGVCDANADNAGGPSLAWSFDRDDAARDQLWDASLLYTVPVGDFDSFRYENDMALIEETDYSYYAADPIEWDWFDVLGEFTSAYTTTAGYGHPDMPTDKAQWAWIARENFQNVTDEAWAAGVSPFRDTPIESLYIQYQAVPTLDALDCLPTQGESGDFVNEAEVQLQRVDSTTPDVVTASVVTPLSGPLTITKTPDGANIVDGSTAWFTITVANDTGRDLQDVTVVDELNVDDPALLYVSDSFVSEPATGVTETGLTATPGGQQIEFTIATLNDGDSVVIRVPVPVPEGTVDLTELNNHATVITPEYPEEPSDDGSITVTNPAPAPDVTKTMLSAGATPGLLTGAPNDPFTATATMVLPPGDSYLDLAATDVLPDGLRFVGYTSVTCAASAPCGDFEVSTASPQHDTTTGTTAIGWWFGDLTGSPLERTFTLTYQVALDDQYEDGSPVLDGDVLTNTITAVSNDSNKVDDTAAPTTPVEPGDFDFTSDDPGEASVLVRTPQLVLDKVASTLGPLSAGDAVTYTVTVENVGTGTAYRVPVTDSPSAATASVTYSTGSELLVDAWSTGDPDIRWIVPSLAPGATATFEYTVTVRGDVQALGLTELANVADVEPYRARPNRLPGDTLFDGVPPVEIRIPLVGSDLSMQKFAGDSCAGETTTFIPGDDVDFCIVVTNAGAGDANAVTLTDTPATGFSYVAGSGSVQVNAAAATPADPTQTTQADTAQLNWLLGTIESGDSVRIRYTLATDDDVSGTLPNRARVVSTTPTGGIWPFNTRGTESTDDAAAVALAASQEISKLPDMQTFTYDPLLGNTVQWQIIVTNPDSVPLTNLVVTDTLPLPFEYVSLTDAGLGGTISTGTHSGGLGDTATWSWAGPLPTGEERVLLITAHLPAGLAIDEVEAASTLYQNEVSLSSDQIETPVENTALATLATPDTPEPPTTIASTGSEPWVVVPWMLALLILGGTLVGWAAVRRRRVGE